MSCLLPAFVVFCAVADFPKETDELAKKKAEYARSVEEAKSKLKAAFDDRIEAMTKKKTVTAEERVKTIDALREEKDTFLNTGHIPYSPMMRDEAIRYLDAVNKAALLLAKEYDRQIVAATKKMDSDHTKGLLREKQNLAVVVGVWDCAGTNFPGRFTWTLYSDFSVNRENDANDALPKGWSFQPNGRILIKNFSPGAPKGGFNDKCQVSWDGQIFEAKNQLGGVYTGRLRKEK